MPDSFFTSTKPRKRKRSETSSSSFRKSTTSFRDDKNKKNLKSNGVVQHKRPRPRPIRPRVDEELSDQTDEDVESVDDMELRVDVDEEEGLMGSGEDENETPAEKRLRLARLYLDSVKEDLGESPVSFSFIYLFVSLVLVVTNSFMRFLIFSGWRIRCS